MQQNIGTLIIIFGFLNLKDTKKTIAIRQCFHISYPFSIDLWN